MASQNQPGDAPESAVTTSEPSAAFTPGPWLVERSDDGHDIRMASAIACGWDHESHHLIEYHHGVEADQDDGGEQFAEAEANARLIAAAPDLLEALIEAEDILDDLTGADDLSDDSELHGTLRKVRAAIAKATGR